MSDTRRLISPSAALRLKAADIIEQVGWCQHTLTNARGHVCLLQALIKVEGWSDTMLKAYSELSKELRNPVRWNNTKGRTQADVVAALRGPYA